MLCHYNVNILNICMKEFDLEIIISDKMTAVMPLQCKHIEHMHEGV